MWFCCILMSCHLFDRFHCYAVQINASSKLLLYELIVSSNRPVSSISGVWSWYKYKVMKLWTASSRLTLGPMRWDFMGTQISSLAFWYFGYLGYCLRRLKSLMIGNMCILIQLCRGIEWWQYKPYVVTFLLQIVLWLGHINMCNTVVQLVGNPKPHIMIFTQNIQAILYFTYHMPSSWALLYLQIFY